ncbi:hypothetical protein BDW60DRAFT_220925 [Aspergillus nidulans var. acristatus]
MSDSTVVLITGVARGIGQALAKAYLSRPNHTVLGTIRDPSAPSLSALSSHVPAQGSRLFLFTLESTNPSHYSDLVSSLTTAGITHLDLVIANAGVAHPAGTPASVDVEDVKNVFDVNALGTLRLFQALRGFLKVGSNDGKRVKWVSVSSGAGSIGGCEVYGTHKVAPAIHASEKWLTAFAIHPGFVQTEMGNKGAQIMGLKEAPNTVEEAVTKTMAAIDSATREDTSGKFLNVIDGAEVPW